MKVEVIEGCCTYAIFFDFERPSMTPKDIWDWGLPSERAIRRLMEHPRSYESQDHPFSTCIIFQYEGMEDLILNAEKDKRWAKRMFKKYLIEETAEQERLKRDQELIEEAEELEFLVNEALGD